MKARVVFRALALACIVGCSESEPQDRAAAAPPDAPSVSPDTPLTAGSAFTVETVERNDRAPAEGSPVGYWETSLRYPRFSSATNGAIASTVNQEVQKVVDRYTSSCPDGGDVQLSADVTLNTPALLSLKYEGMTMCSSMPRPGPFAGGLTFDLGTGRVVSLDNELVSDAAVSSKLKTRLAELAQQRLEETQGEDMECLLSDRLEYFVAPAELTFIEVLSGVDPLCSTDVKVSLADMGEYLRPESVLRSD